MSWALMNMPPPPMASSGHRLYRLAVDHDPGVVVTEPAPGVGGADRIHDLLFEHLRQRPPPKVQSSERERVHARIVVFVERSCLVARPRVAFVGLVVWWVRLVGRSPSHTLSVADERR